MSIQMKKLHDRLNAIAARMKELKDGAEPKSATEVDDLSAEIDTINASIETITANVKKLEEAQAKIDALAEPNARVIKPVDGPITSGARSLKGDAPWKSQAEFMRSVKGAKLRPSQTDERLLNAPTTAGQEGINEDGGFLVPVDHRTEIMSQVFGEGSLASMCDEILIGSNKLSLPQDTITPWDNTQGVRAFWLAEGAQKIQTKPKFDKFEVELNKLAALVPVTDELLEDAQGGLMNFLNRKVAEKFDWMLSDAIIRGSGPLMPLGILNSPGRVIQTVPGGQGAGTIKAENILAMYARMNPASLNRAVWLINPTALAQLPLLVMPGGTQPVPLFMPANGLASAPFGTLLGRPIIPRLEMSAVGTEGDIAFVDMKNYAIVRRAGNTGVKFDVSMHVFFDTDHTAFRYVLRVGGAPYWKAPIQPPNGGDTVSGFVTLESDRS